MIGLIALSSDMNIEKDFHQYYNGNIFTSRVIFNNPINQKNLFDIKNELKDIKKKFPVDTSKYIFGCTSGTAVIGEYIENNFLNPLTATLNWCKHYNFKQLGLFTPYNHDVHQTVKNWFENKGIKILEHKCLNIDSDITVANLDHKYLKDQILNFNTTADAVFLSCTALPVLGLLDQISQETGKKYTSSNSSLIWQLMSGDQK